MVDETSKTCLFCKIAAGEIPSQVVYETDTILAFNDISPQAPTHILVIPKRHIGNIVEFDTEDSSLIGEIFNAIQIIANEHSLIDPGFRVVTNTGSDGGQAVNHIHFHVLGGRQMDWPPG